MFNFHITKIMRNEYNDEQIMSPNVMHNIAKAYNEMLKNINKEQEINKKTSLSTEEDYSDFINIYTILKETHHNFTLLKEYCSKNFYHKKEIEIKSILFDIKELANYISEYTNVDVKTTFVSKYNNYCQIITESMNVLLKLTNTCFNLFIISDKKTAMQKMHSGLIEVIIKISNLITPCKYREF